MRFTKYPKFLLFLLNEKIDKLDEERNTKEHYLFPKNTLEKKILSEINL